MSEKMGKKQRAPPPPPRDSLLIEDERSRSRLQERSKDSVIRGME